MWFFLFFRFLLLLLRICRTLFFDLLSSINFKKILSQYFFLIDFFADFPSLLSFIFVSSLYHFPSFSFSVIFYWLTFWFINSCFLLFLVLNKTPMFEFLGCVCFDFFHRFQCLGKYLPCLFFLEFSKYSGFVFFSVSLQLFGFVFISIFDWMPDAPWKVEALPIPSIHGILRCVVCSLHCGTQSVDTLVQRLLSGLCGN